MAKPLKTLGEVPCPKCAWLMERRSHKQPPKKKPFYFSEWDYCPKCRHLQHYERYKVVLQPKKHVMSQMGEEKPMHPLERKMLVDLLPGLRYAASRLRDWADPEAAFSLESEIAMIEDGKIPPFLEQDGQKGGK